MSELDKLKQQFEDLEKKVAALAKETVRIGTILPYGGSTEPKDGWLFCDGRSLSRGDEYKKLYEVIGSNFGAPDENHFNLPDLRGRFVRGVDAGAGRDLDVKSRLASQKGGNVKDAVGSTQEDDFEKHNHSATVQWARYYRRNSNDNPYTFCIKDNSKAVTMGDIALPVKDEGGSETRPKNIYVNWIIKAR